jgi:hypothetical protein
MTSSLESRLAEELRHEAAQVGVVPGLAERVVARAHVVRRRRGLTAAAVTGAVVVALVAFVGGGVPHTSTSPPAHKTPHLSASATLSESLRQLAEGDRPDVDYVVGSEAHVGGSIRTLPSDWVVSSLLRAGARWGLVAQTASGGVVATMSTDGDLIVIDRNDAIGLAVDPTGRFLAWGSEHQDASAQEQLTEYDLTENQVVARHEIDQPAEVVGWAKEGVIASYRVDPGGSPVVWDPHADTLTKVWGGSGSGPTFVAYSPTSHKWVLNDEGCGVVLKRIGTTAPAEHCAEGIWTPAAFAQDELLVVASADTLRVLDSRLTDTGDGHPIPAGTVPMQIVPSGGYRRFVVVNDTVDGSSHVLGCNGNGPCVRALDAAPGEQVVLASS